MEAVEIVKLTVQWQTKHRKNTIQRDFAPFQQQNERELLTLQE